MRRYNRSLLGFLVLWAGCAHRKPTEAPRDYDSVRQRADQAQQSLNKEKGPTGQ